MATQSQLYSALVKVGMSSAHAKIGAAVAMAESGGVLTAHNSTPPDNSYGPWQINMIGALGPSRRAAYGLSANTDLYDLDTSARVAKAISHNGANWNPWSTFTHGTYKQYLSNGVTETSTGSTGATAVDAGFHLPVPDPLAPFKDFGQVVNVVTSTAHWVSNANNWVRVGYVIGGAIVVIVALDMYISNSGPGKSVMKLAKKAPIPIPV